LTVLVQAVGTVTSNSAKHS